MANENKQMPAATQALLIYRISGAAVLLMVLAPLLSSELDAYLSNNGATKLPYYLVAVGLIALNVWMRFRFKKATGKFPNL